MPRECSGSLRAGFLPARFDLHLLTSNMKIKNENIPSPAAKAFATSKNLPTVRYVGRFHKDADKANDLFIYVIDLAVHVETMTGLLTKLENDDQVRSLLSEYSTYGSKVSASDLAFLELSKEDVSGSWE